MKIGLAHAARYHADDHFVGARGAKFQLLQCEGCRTFRNDGGGDLHSKLSKLAGGESIDTASGEACQSAELPSDMEYLRWNLGWNLASRTWHSLAGPEPNWC